MNERNLFVAALRQPDVQSREAFLIEACGDDASLRKNVEALLREHGELGSFLEAPAADLEITAAASNVSAESPGTVIGRYKLMEQIGEGGMGLVFVAEQHHPVRRKVALKLIKPGMDSRQVIARFEAERQALALMDHPNIARVIDGGTAESGRPYFVMELVRGSPITEYCDENRLTTRARLDLFLQVCSAVQHAHQKGIIHRDIKPSNVMVVSHDGTPVVKAIDFGIAKAIGQQLTDKTIYTQFVQFVGTPAYMSPEQAGQSGLDIDTRTDVYALGVLLYELLTGTTPFDKDRLKDASYDEIRRIIRDEEPPRPSTRVSTLNQQAGSTISAQRQIEPKQLSVQLRGELDWIVMKSLEKDRTRRYESASAMAKDVERHLNNDPVEASPPSSIYRLKKFVSRKKRALTLSALVGAILLLSGFGLWRGELQRAAIEQAVSEDLETAERHLRQEQSEKARDALERAKGRLAGSGLDALQAKVDQRYRELDQTAQLEEARMKALAVASDFNRNGPLVASDRACAAAFAELGLDVTALPAEEAARRIRASAIHNQLVVALDHWAYVKGQLSDAGGDALRAVAQLADDDVWRQKLRDPKVVKNRKTLELLAEENGVLDQPPASLLILSSLLKAEKSWDAALRLLRRAQRRYPADFRINFDLGMMLGYETPSDRKSNLPESVRFLQAALALQPRNPHVYIHLADALGSQGLEHVPEAQEVCRKAIEMKPDFAEAYFFLGNGLMKEKRIPEAEEAFRKVIELEPNNARAHMSLGVALFDQRRFREAEAPLLEVIRLKPGFVAKAHFLLGDSLAYEKRMPEAVEMFRKSIELDPNNVLAHLKLGAVLFDQRLFREAEGSAREAIRLKAVDDFTYWLLCECLFRQQRHLEAVSVVRKAAELKISNVDTYYTGACAAALAGCGQVKDGADLDPQERLRLREQALDWLRSSLAGESEKLTKEPDKARPAVRKRIQHWKKDSDFNGVRGAEALAQLPESERRQWQKLWEDVDALERAADGPE